MRNKLRIFTAAFFATVIIIGLVSAIPYLIVSNPVEVEVVAKATMALQATPTAILVGDDVLLTATLSNGKDGVYVQFKLNGTNIDGPVLTGRGGIAVKAYNTLVVGKHIFTAEADHPLP